MNHVSQTLRTLEIEQVMLGALRMLALIVTSVRRHDRDLSEQMRRAASSVALNLSEGLASCAGNRRSRLESAAGSLRETRTALSVACAWGYISPQTATPIDQELDRIAAMLYRLRRK